jgi:class 3 adenylate cyclase
MSLSFATDPGTLQILSHLEKAEYTPVRAEVVAAVRPWRTLVLKTPMSVIASRCPRAGYEHTRNATGCRLAQKLGLGQYVQHFAENDINFSILPDLTDQDLKELGVLSLGHRRQLLRAITEVRGGDTAPPKPPGESVAPPAQQRDTAERRQVTVMFSDLVGSTALSARMDPEDLREVISAYQKCVAETVQRFGGFVAKYMGDGVLVYFGYPQAHEDDAERAVRAGLKLVAAISDLKTHAPLQTRIGIATGLVVVGDLIGSGPSQEQAIVGETPNLAARLQGVAEPNSVVIAESTRKLVGNFFELEALEPSTSRGSPGRCGPGQRYDPLLLRAASTLCMQAD